MLYIHIIQLLALIIELQLDQFILQDCASTSISLKLQEDLQVQLQN